MTKTLDQLIDDVDHERELDRGDVERLVLALRVLKVRYMLFVGDGARLAYESGHETLEAAILAGQGRLEGDAYEAEVVDALDGQVAWSQDDHDADCVVDDPSAGRMAYVIHSPTIDDLRDRYAGDDPVKGALLRHEEELAAEGMTCNAEVHWADRLAEEEGVMTVKGTLVPVATIVALIVDGMTWADILRSHPELDEADIRACLVHAIESE